MGSKKIAALINNEFKAKYILVSKGKVLSVSFKTICRYLNDKLGTPKQIRKLSI